MKENHLIEQMMVVGAGRKFTAALIVPSYTNLKPWCKQNNIEYHSNQELIKDSRVIALFQDVVAGFNPEFNHVEQIKRITLLPDEWAIESGELTPTGKMKRKVITEKYQREIDAMYAGETAESVSVTH
jgi:long-chain acyl-CoA synthetase